MMRFTFPRLKTWYKVHKWISIVTGAFIFMWLTSGIIMVSPSLTRGLRLVPAAQPTDLIDYQAIKLSPAEAISHVDAQTGSNDEIGEVRLVRLGATLAYRILIGSGEYHFVDVTSGELFAISGERAAQIAQETFAIEGQVADIERLDRYDLAYLPIEYDVPLPVYRITFDDDLASFVHIAPGTGEIFASARLGRGIQALEALHTFAFMKAVFGAPEDLTTILLWASISATLFAALVGYYMALPHKRPARPLRE